MTTWCSHIAKSREIEGQTGDVTKLHVYCQCRNSSFVASVTKQVSSSTSFKDAMPDSGVGHFLNVLAAFRNGSYYATKIRSAHAVVTTVLFSSKDLLGKLDGVFGLTWQHARNLSYFAAIYKVVLALGHIVDRALNRPCGASKGLRPSSPWHAALAGAVGGYFIWGHSSSLNYNIVLYLLARIIVGQAQIFAKQGVWPFNKFSVSSTNSTWPSQADTHEQFEQVYPFLAAAVWAVVQWQFEAHRSQCHR